MSEALERLSAAVRRSGLVPEESSGVVLVSGGADSACALAGCVGVAGAGRVVALHVDHGLRPDSGLDADTCRQLCDSLGVELVVERVEPGEGNVQARAREERYRAAEVLRGERGLDWVATGHTRTDLAETVIYRLATSPGRRALLGLPARRARLVRPLLGLDRSDTRELAEAAGIPYRDDPSNEDPRYARNRIRHEVLTVLRELNPALEKTIATTREELQAEARVLDIAAAELIPPDVDTLPAAGLISAEPALARIALERLAERVTGLPVTVRLDQLSEVLRLAESAEGGSVELGGGVRILCEHGTVRVRSGVAGEPPPARLPVPGGCRFGRWQLAAEVVAPRDPAGPDLATLDADRLADELEVRAWREGDRIRPLGLGGSKSLQDLLTDAGVPRSLRHELPIVLSEGEIAWVAGVAVGEPFRITEDTGRVAVLTARAL